jgi:hypothetical protein
LRQQDKPDYHVHIAAGINGAVESDFFDWVVVIMREMGRKKSGRWPAADAGPDGEIAQT